MTNGHDKIGDRLRQIRDHLGDTQAAFADRFGVSRREVSGYELGQRAIPSNVLAELDRLGFCVDWILSNKGEMLRPPPEIPSIDLKDGVTSTGAQPAISYRWFLAVPVGFLAWLLVDLALPPILGFFVYAVEHVTAFVSHLAAVVAAGYLSSRRLLRQTVAAITVVFIAIRLIMIVPVLDSAGEYIGLYVIETLSALAGLGLGIVFVFRKWGNRRPRQRS